MVYLVLKGHRYIRGLSYVFQVIYKENIIPQSPLFSSYFYATRNISIDSIFIYKKLINYINSCSANRTFTERKTIKKNFFCEILEQILEKKYTAIIYVVLVSFRLVLKRLKKINCFNPSVAGC